MVMGPEGSFVNLLVSDPASNKANGIQSLNFRIKRLPKTGPSNNTSSANNAHQPNIQPSISTRIIENRTSLSTTVSSNAGNALYFTESELLKGDGTGRDSKRQTPSPWHSPPAADRDMQHAGMESPRRSKVPLQQNNVPNAVSDAVASSSELHPVSSPRRESPNQVLPENSVFNCYEPHLLRITLQSRLITSQQSM